MPEKYFFVSALNATGGNDIWYSRVFSISFSDESDLGKQQDKKQTDFLYDNQLSNDMNTPWSGGFDTFELACNELNSDILKPGTTVHTLAWPKDANQCPNRLKRRKK